jgi:hypothetical protein
MALPKLTTSNIAYLIVCLLGVAAFFLVGIYPNMKSMNELETDETILTQTVQSQELLYPIYRQLIKEVQQPIPSKLILPTRSTLSQNDLNQLNHLLREIARKSDVIFIRAVPDANSYLEDSGSLVMNTSFSGEFFNFRNLLYALCSLPYLESIDQIIIETQATERTIDLKLRLLQN